ncbi:MAG: anthranilate synthase component II [Sarcina sp.]
MFLMIDNYDSFVYNLLRYFNELNQEIRIYKNDAISIEEIENLNPEGIILSPGPKSPAEAILCLEILEKFKGKIPILGICLGHQCIGHVFGGKIVKGDKPIHGKIYNIINDGKGVFKGLPQNFKVTRYHSLMIEKDSVKDELEISALSSDNVVMGVRHKLYDIEGVQFHPEAALTEFGHDILKNFIERCKI